VTTAPLRNGLKAAALLVPLVVAFGGCGGSDKLQVKTVTVEHSPPPAAAPARKHHQTKTPRAPVAAPSRFVQCDSNIEAKARTTTCPFAQNAFWQYWTSGQAASIKVYSPAAHSTLTTTCTPGEGQVVCTTTDAGMAKFSQASVDNYSSTQADAYASTHDLGPDPYDTSSSTPGTSSTPEPAPTPPPEPPAGGNIPNYANGNGYRVQCEDGMYSHSGGIQGACSGHGGLR
jgi:hypothetical protein